MSLVSANQLEKQYVETVEKFDQLYRMLLMLSSKKLKETGRAQKDRWH